MSFEFFSILNFSLLFEKLKNPPQPSIRLTWVLTVLFLEKEAGTSCEERSVCLRRSESRGDSSSWRSGVAPLRLFASPVKLKGRFLYGLRRGLFFVGSVALHPRDRNYITDVIINGVP